MELLTPGIGLIFWTVIVFVGLFSFLTIFAWKPIASALRTRENMIEDALQAADLAKQEMAQIKADNEYLLHEARMERDKILQEALSVANQIKEEAKNSTQQITNKMLEEARATIDQEKRIALAEVKSIVSSLSLEIAEKILRENLSSDKSQTALVEKYLKETKLN